MKANLSRTVGQVMVIVAFSTVIALGFNFVRTKGLELDRNYFDTAKPVTPQPKSTQGYTASPSANSDVNPSPKTTDASDSGEATTSAAVTSTTSDPYPVGELGFREVTTRQVHELLNDPRAESQAVLFVDARNDEYFQAGHIPRAVQLDHYYLDQYMPNVLPLAMQAQWVVVYCGGGDCEDSMLACNDLVLEGVPQENILLYKGGWKEWTDAGHPVETAIDE